MQGIGTDIVKIDRIAKIYAKYQERFVLKILSASEYKYFHNLTNKHRVAFLAKRFAAKEAVAKALGSGFGQHLSFHDIEIKKESNGKPIVKLSEHGLKLVKELSASKVLISISDEKEYAIAYSILI